MTRAAASIGAFLVAFAGGCASVEYGEAVARGDRPWYVVSISSPDADLERGEMNVYKLVRRADSPQGRSEGLKADLLWGEGRRGIVRKSGGEIGMSVTITPDRSDPGKC